MIRNGLKLDFMVRDFNDVDLDLGKLKGKKIISLIPWLNTKICDNQTMEMKNWSADYKDITFITISLDEPEVAKKWCGVRGGSGKSMVVSDLKYKQIGGNFIPLIDNVLARGFIIVNDKNEVVDFDINSLLTGEPNYSLVDKYLEARNKW